MKIHILYYMYSGEGLPRLVIAEQPQTRRLVIPVRMRMGILKDRFMKLELKRRRVTEKCCAVLVVGDVNVVGPRPNNFVCSYKEIAHTHAQFRKIEFKKKKKKYFISKKSR